MKANYIINLTDEGRKFPHYWEQLGKPTYPTKKTVTCDRRSIHIRVYRYESLWRRY